MTTNSANCAWCEKPFAMRRGGSEKRFCSSSHRIAFHSALRDWGERAFARGVLTAADIKGGDPEAWTLVVGGVTASEASKTDAAWWSVCDLLVGHVFDELSDDEMAALPDHVWALIDRVADEATARTRAEPVARPPMARRRNKCRTSYST